MSLDHLLDEVLAALGELVGDEHHVICYGSLDLLLNPGHLDLIERVQLRWGCALHTDNLLLSLAARGRKDGSEGLAGWAGLLRVRGGRVPAVCRASIGE